MNVGLVIYGRLDQMTGGYLYDCQLVEHLRQHGDRVEVFSLPWRSYLVHLSHNLSHRLDRWVESRGLDLLLQDELNHPSLVLTNRRLRRHALPLVAIVHHLRSSEPWGPASSLLYRAVEGAYLRTVDALVCNSRPTLHAVQELAGRRRPSVIAWPGADRLPSELSPEQVGARAREPGPLRLLYVGALVRRKGLDILLRAMARLSPDTCTLTVVGEDQRDPKYAQQVHRLMQDLALGKRVDIRGPVDDAVLQALMVTRQVLAIPSRHEGFGIGYLEGMGHGLVCLASASGGASDLIEDGVHGYLIPADQEALLVARLAELHSNRDRLSQMGQAALDRARRHPTWETSAHQIRQFLEQCVRQTASVGASTGW